MWAVSFAFLIFKPLLILFRRLLLVQGLGGAELCAQRSAVALQPRRPLHQLRLSPHLGHGLPDVRGGRAAAQDGLGCAAPAAGGAPPQVRTALPSRSPEPRLDPTRAPSFPQFRESHTGLTVRDAGTVLVLRYAVPYTWSRGRQGLHLIG